MIFKRKQRHKYIFYLGGFPQGSDQPIHDLLVALGVHVEVDLGAVLQEAGDEGARRQVAKGDNLHVRVAVLDLRQVPEDKVPGAAVVLLRLLLVKVDRHNFDARLKDQRAVGQVFGCSPYGRYSFHKRHCVL